MKFSEEDKASIQKFYGGLVRYHGVGTPESVSWQGLDTQKIRFKILSEIGDLSGKSVLDVGCGSGELYEFLNERFDFLSYSGIDIVPEFIAEAGKRHKDINFIEGDFSFYKAEKFDYLFASGSLSFKIQNYKQVYFGIIKKMFKTAKIGVAFNMLNAEHHNNDKTFAAYHISEVEVFCKSLTSKVVIRQGYLTNDFTVYLYH